MRGRSVRSPAATTLTVTLALVLAVGSAAAGMQQRVGGAIESVAPRHMVVNDRNGVRVEVEFADPLTVLIARPLNRAAVAVGRTMAFVTVQGRDATLRVVQVLVLPDAMQTARDGGIAWDLKPDNVMIIGPVTAITERGGVQQLTVSTQDGTKIVVVSPETPVASVQPAAASDLRAGEIVFLVGLTGSDGTVTASRIIVSRDGAAPPM